jgi:hypothetical protein|nr:MAG TPA: Protein of unknown function (DUF2746) [Caudoviricetes sp.]
MYDATHPLVAVMATPEVVAALAALGIAICGFITLQLKALSARLRQRIDAVHESAEAARSQVENHHGSNLRDDVDQLARQVREGMTAIQAAQNRADARAEREHDERVSEIRLLREDLGRIREDLSAQRDVLDDCPRH